MTAKEYITRLNLLPHPEGGYYKESYRSLETIEEGLPARFKGPRSFSTAIYYLLEQGDFSAFHRISSDECWHYYAGGTLLIQLINNAGNYECIKLGADLSEGEVLQFVVPANTWFASEPAAHVKFSLVGCTVSPGFNFEDFEIADKGDLIKRYPQHENMIVNLCR